MSTESHTPVASDGRNIQTVLDELRELDGFLKTLQEQCMEKVESGRIRDHKKDNTRAKWIRETRETAAERRRVLESIAAYQAGEKLDELESNLRG